MLKTVKKFAWLFACAALVFGAVSCSDPEDPAAPAGSGPATEQPGDNTGSGNEDQGESDTPSTGGDESGGDVTVPESVDLTFGGDNAVTLSTTKDTYKEVTLVSGKTPAASGSDYYVFLGGSSSIISIGADKQWKFDAGYVQADGSGRTLKVDLSAFAGYDVTLTVKAGPKNDTSGISIACNGGTSVSLTGTNYEENTVTFDIAKGTSEALITNSGQAVRYFGISIAVKQ